MELYKAKNRVIGVDVTIAATNYAIVDVRGDILAEGSFPTMDYPNVGDYVSELARRIVELSENNGGLGTDTSSRYQLPERQHHNQLHP